MPFLPDLQDDEFPAAMTDAVEAQIKAFGFVLNSTRIVGHTPHINEAAGGLSRATSRNRQIPRRLHALINLRVAAIVGCPL